jgi:hypothetical protein
MEISVFGLIRSYFWKMSFPRWEESVFCGFGWKWLGWRGLRQKRGVSKDRVVKIVLGKVLKSCQTSGKKGRNQSRNLKSRSMTAKAVWEDVTAKRQGAKGLTPDGQD